MISSNTCFSGRWYPGRAAASTRRLMGLWIRPTPTPEHSWALQVAGRAASFPSRAGRDRTGEKRGAFPPPGVIPQAAGRRGTVGVVVSPPLARGVGGVVLSYFMSLALSPEGGVSAYAGSVRVRVQRCARRGCVTWAAPVRAVHDGGCELEGVFGCSHCQFESSEPRLRGPHNA